MDRVRRTTEKTMTSSQSSDSITLSLPRFSTINFPTLLLIVFIFVVGFGFGSLYTKTQPTTAGNTQAANNPPSGGTDQTAPTAAPQFVDVKVGKLPVLGEENAPVTIVEFSDFQCPFCRSFFEDTYAQLKKEYIDTGKVKLSYRHLPLDFHPAAQVSAEAAECANDQGKFWEYHDLLYQEQAKQGTGTIQYTKDDIKTWMSAIPGLDQQTFSECVDAGKHTQVVKDDASYGASVGVSATPSFFVNGQKVEGAQPFSVFKSVIDAELAKVK
jgi:protein-disulfide isomerase